MNSTTLERRSFLRAAGAAFLASLVPAMQARAETSDLLFAAAFGRRSSESFGVALLDEGGKVLQAIDLPDRGHDITFDPVSGRAVVFARQPGTFAVVFDPAGKVPQHMIASVPGRHFYGHGVFSPDGRLLYATENDFDAARGMIGIYDATDGFKRKAEFPTGGVGPHEVLLAGDGRTLVVANGGIETHPDFGRAELNLSTMKPSLSFLDRETGDLLENHELPPALHQLSIRHMAFDEQGRIWFGCQHRGPATEKPPLVGHVRRGEDLSLLAMPDQTLWSLRNYVGSVSANPDAGTVAVSSPQGNAFLVIEAASGKVLKNTAMTEVCGLAADGTGYLATTGLGVFTPPGGAEIQAPDTVWDNHILRLG